MSHNVHQDTQETYSKTPFSNLSESKNLAVMVLPLKTLPSRALTACDLLARSSNLATRFDIPSMLIIDL